MSSGHPNLVTNTSLIHFPISERRLNEFISCIQEGPQLETRSFPRPALQIHDQSLPECLCLPSRIKRAKALVHDQTPKHGVSLVDSRLSNMPSDSLEVFLDLFAHYPNASSSTPAQKKAMGRNWSAAQTRAQTRLCPEGICLRQDDDDPSHLMAYFLLPSSSNSPPENLHQACLIRPEHPRPASQNRTTGRRLPEIPCEERLTGERIAAFYTHSEILNNPIHSTVPFRTAAEPTPPIRLPTFPVLSHMTANDCASYEVERQVFDLAGSEFEEASPETSLRQPANHSPPLSTLSKPNIAQFLPQAINSTIAYCPKSQVDKGYQFSYGMDASLMKSSTVSSQKHINSFGIMEDSYYEDGLNGNNSAAMDMLVGRAVNQLDNRRHSGYNLAEDNSSGVSSCCTSASTNADQPGVSGLLGPVIRKRKTSKDSNGPTHRAQFPFFPRHPDEILLEVGDAVRVDRECEDHWCYGTNLRSGQQGIFPSAHVCEIDLVDEICQRTLGPNIQNLPIPLKQERDTFYLTLLASMEVCHHKGNDVLVQAINKVCSMYQQKDEILVPQTVLMEVSFRGIHVIDKRKKDFFRCPAFDYFYSLQNISFCGAHPKQLRYFGFITKHPLLPRFACHVFLSQESTQPIVEAIGRAFKRSYDEYMAFAHPTEDIFIE
ncbi:phosphotyrosine interaction domain (PTB/PID) domain-containing protein [Ditylenchus destructor]|uniref:Phosphotyrosine interaction domain (PTB/PID) domain-containing protein n=1 Tax=Ditylenchus destructor TaxID=166010 RepID=A0AAD4R0J8_9BILA|nr:phosphotyrosine interaction domain (PTB/PID) domain-containing protein [Ditylenchus destructor]